MNKLKECSTANTYDYVRYSTVRLYYKNRLNGMNKGTAATEEEKLFFGQTAHLLTVPKQL